MQVVGGGSVIEYGPKDEVRHVPEPDELWQESVVLFWWDTARGVGGYHRIGHEPNVKTGPAVLLFNNIYTPEYLYKDLSTLPLREVDKLPNGFGGGDTCKFEYTDHAIWTVSASDLKATIHAHDMHTPVDIYPKKSDYARDFSPNHMEVASKITGEVTLKGKTYSIDGLGFRDHGWGHRDWTGIVSHRWIAMTFEDGSMALMHTFHASTNELTRFGCVIRDNQLTYAAEVDIVTYLEPDGLSHRGGKVTAVLTTGERMVFEFVPLQKGVVTWFHGIGCVDTICRVTCGDKVGIADFEITNNALRGAHQPLLAINAIDTNGLHALRA